MTTAERRVLWLRNSVNVVQDEDGLIRLQGVMVNITELKEAEQALREESRTLERSTASALRWRRSWIWKSWCKVVTEAGKEVTGAEFGAFFVPTSQRPR